MNDIENFRLYVIGVLHEIDTPYNLHATASDIERWREDAIRRYKHDASFHHRVDSICAAAPIASLQAKSDAEVVCEWLRKNMTWSLNYFGDGGACLENVVSKTRIDAANLADLAKKIGEMK